MRGPEPPPAERALGLSFYATTTPGAGGPLKERAEAFKVTEISAYPLPDPAGAFTVLRIVSRNWEQHELAQRLAQRLGLPPHAVDWAGTKDRRAVAERLFSYRGAPPRRLDLADVELLEAYRARSGLVLGHHYGNAFEIRVPDGGVARADREAIYHATHEELRALGGFPNLFGPQRFGEVRPVTHEVGRALARGDPARAVELYLTWMPDASEEAGGAARAAFAQHHDAQRALREFPGHYRFERQLLDHLARGQPPERALRALSRELRMLFVHAYQSLLFNRWLGGRTRAGLSLREPVAGDVLLRLARDGTVPGTHPIPVTLDNLDEATELARRGRALLAGPLVGFETPIPQGPGGELIHGLLAEEGISPDDFRMPRTPDVASKGSYRPALVPLPPISIAVDPEGAWFRFALPKGSYATVLLREFTKPGALVAASESTRVF